MNVNHMLTWWGRQRVIVEFENLYKIGTFPATCLFLYKDKRAGIPVIVRCSLQPRNVKVVARDLAIKGDVSWYSEEMKFDWFISELKRLKGRFGHMTIIEMLKDRSQIAPMSLVDALESVNFPDRTDLQKWIDYLGVKKVFLPKRTKYNPLQDPNQLVLTFQKE